MKVLLFNGSPHTEGCTYTALQTAAKELNAQGIETELFQIGSKVWAGCRGCGACRKAGKCVFGDSDGLNEIIEACKTADGFLFGSPVHYASPAGAMIAFMDRLFYAGSPYMAHKPAAAVASARRAGTTAALDVLNKYFFISQMPIVSSTYWNMVHGSNPSDVAQDLEGLQTMRNLGQNMAWMLKAIEAGKQAGIEPPQADKSNKTNFIR